MATLELERLQLRAEKADAEKVSAFLSAVLTIREAEIERLQAQYARLRAAAHEIYWSANWTADREVDHEEMWDELRDAGGLEAVNAGGVDVNNAPG